MIPLSESQKAILIALQEQGTKLLRIDFAALAQAVGLDAAKVETSLKELEGLGVIKKYSAIVDAEKLGFLTLFVDFICEDELGKVIKSIENFKNTKDYIIVAAYIITGDKDIHLEVKVKGIEGYKRFIRAFAVIQAVGTACGTLGYEKLIENRIIELGSIVKSEER